MTDSSKTSASSRGAHPKKQRSPFIRVALVFITSVVLADALIGEKGFVATIRARNEYNQLASQIARMRAENARLRELARRLREDPTAIEEIARRELGLIRPGETVFIIKDVPPPKP